MSERLNKVSRHGRVAFLAGMNDFCRLINSGHTLRSIYDESKAQLGISYSQFTRYVGKYIATAKQPELSKRGFSTDISPTTPTNVPSTEIKSHIRSTPPYFQHDASSGNNRQDLI